MFPGLSKLFNVQEKHKLSEEYLDILVFHFNISIIFLKSLD